MSLELPTLQPTAAAPALTPDEIRAMSAEIRTLAADRDLDALRAKLSEADWLETVAPIFRNAITTIENLFDPEIVVLGGLAFTLARYFAQSLLQSSLEAWGED